MESSSREASPPTITMANGFCESLPIPVDMAAGSRPKQATRAVIMMGRRRRTEASRVALKISLPSSRSLLMNEYRITLVCTATPINATKPSIDETLKLVCVMRNASSPPTGSVTSTLKKMMSGNFKLPYSANRISRINSTVKGKMIFICSSDARYSLYSPPQSNLYPMGSFTAAATFWRASPTALEMCIRDR